MQYTILNVDDHEAVRYLRTHVVRRAGFNVLEAANGEDAVRMAAEYLPQVVLLDVRLPGMDGLEVCQRIKGFPDTATIQVLHISAEAVASPLQAMGLENGADGYLVEPVNPEVLLGTIRALIRQWQKQSDLRVALQELQAAEQQVKVLRGLLPICAGCKKIRDTDGDWQILERYIHVHSEATFSHGLCPECLHTWSTKDIVVE